MATKGKKASKETRKNLSEIKKRMFKEGKLKLPNNLGRKHTEETKVKIGKANSNKMKEYWKNNKPTEKQLRFQEENHIKERCKKCGAIIGKNSVHNCSDIREKQSLSHIGLKQSEETRKKRSESNKGKHDRIKSLNERIKISASNQKIDIINWCGFKGNENERLRKTSMWKIWREKVFLRDNFTCQNNNCKYCNNIIGGKNGGGLNPHHIKPRFLYPELTFNINNGITYCKDYHLKSNLHKNMQKES